MMETSRVLTMLNAQASRQLQNEQLEAAKRTVNEAIRYYEESKSEAWRNSGHHESALARCQAQVSVLLKLKIGRREAAMGAQTQNDRLAQSGQKLITQSTRSLRGIIQDSIAPISVSSQPSHGKCALTELKQALEPILQKQESRSVTSSISSHQPRDTVCVVPRASSGNIPVSASTTYAAAKPTALEEWLRFARSVNSPHNIPLVPSSSNCSNRKDDGEAQDLDFCDCVAQIKRKAQQNAKLQVQQAQQTMIETTITTTSGKAASGDE